MLKKPRFSLQTTIAVFACIVVASALLVADIIIGEKMANNAQMNASEESTEIARIVANTPLIIEALDGERKEGEIQAFTQKVLSVSEVRFITVMDMQRIRKSHPNKEKIGEYYEEDDADPAFEGKECTSINEGSLGVSMRSFSPVFTPEGKQVGVVLVGVMAESVEKAVENNRSGMYAGVGVGMVVGILGSLLLARRIKKILFGLEPFAIAKLFQERSAMLHSVREGVLAVDKECRMTIANEAAIRLFERAGISGNPIGKKVDEYVPNTRLQRILVTGKVELDQEQDLNGITILANRIPIIVNGEIVGALATFRDKTEIRKMAEKLTGVSSYAEALRAQTHEFMNKLHVIQGMVRMGYYDRLHVYIHDIASNYQVEVGSVVTKIKDPVLAGFLIGKLSLAREAGINMSVSEDSFLPEPAESEVVHELITIVGNLLDNALEAVENSQPKHITIDFSWEDDRLLISVEDNGKGIDSAEQEKIFEQGYSTKGDNRGVGLYLVKQSVLRLGGQIMLDAMVGSGTVFRVSIPYWIKE